MNLDTLDSRTQVLALCLLVSGGLCLGAAPFIVKILPLDPEVSAFYRVAISVPILAFMFGLLTRDDSQRRNIHRFRSGYSVWGLLVLTSIFFAADLLFMHIAITNTDVAVATLLTNVAPFFVGILGLVGLTTHPDKHYWMMMPIAFAGCVLLIGQPLDAHGDLFGNVYALLAAFMYACYMVGVKRLRETGLSTLLIMISVAVTSTVALLPVFVIYGAPVPSELGTIVMLFALVAFGQLLGQGLVTISLKTLPVAFSSLVLLIQPVVAGALSWIFLGEVLIALQLIGMTLVLMAILGTVVLPHLQLIRPKIRTLECVRYFNNIPEDIQ